MFMATQQSVEFHFDLLQNVLYTSSDADLNTSDLATSGDGVFDLEALQLMRTANSPLFKLHGAMPQKVTKLLTFDPSNLEGRPQFVLFISIRFRLIYLICSHLIVMNISTILLRKEQRCSVISRQIILEFFCARFACKF